MRLATLLAAVLLTFAPAGFAQALQDFYPLDVGNEWVYRVNDDGTQFFQQERIVGVATEGGVEYAQRERCDFALMEGGVGTPECSTALIRITASGEVVIRQPDGTERQEACGLGEPSGTEVPCDDVTGGGEAALEVMRDDDQTVRVGDYEVASRTVQAFEPVNVFIDPPPASYAAGIGRLAVLPFAGYSERFEYARVGDAEYGLNPLDPDPASFFPLAVGTVREYIQPISTVGGPPVREDDVRTVVLDGETWTLRRRQERSLGSSNTHTRTESRELFRYDAVSENVLVRSADGSAQPVFPCLVVPVGESECQGTPVLKALAGSVEVGGETRQAATLAFSYPGPSPTLAAGLGVVYVFGESFPDTELRFIDVGPLDTGDPLPLGTPLGDIFPTEIDPTPAHRYYPLSVGDEWHTVYGEFGIARSYQRRRIIGAETVGGVLYAVEEFSTATPEAPAWVAERTRRVRFDARSGFPVTDAGQRLSPCPLDEPVNANLEGEGDIVTCDDDRTSAAYRFFGPVTQDNGPTIPADTVKTFSYSGLANPVGLTFYVLDLGPAPAISGGPAYEHLAYARVLQPDGSVRSFGTPLPVANEDGASPTALAITASPNPTAGALRLAIETPTAGAVAVEAFDALGRRVYSGVRDATVGALDLSLDASGWAPGVYVVRVRTADSVASARVVRR